MTRVFADTSHWIALLNPRDELHVKAIDAARTYASDQVVTSEMVLVEFLNAFSDRGPRLRRAVAQAVRSIESTTNVVVIPQTGDQFEQALRRYDSRPDQDWSLTDCASFLIMETERIEAALTYDHLLWHGNVKEALERLSNLLIDLELTGNPSAAAEKLAAGVAEFETYIRNHQESIPNYGERYRQGDTISTAFAESTINHVVSRRFVKRQQMHSALRGAHLLLRTRTKVLNNELEEVFRRWYPRFRVQAKAA